jgi:hypothetical protein
MITPGGGSVWRSPIAWLVEGGFVRLPGVEAIFFVGKAERWRGRLKRRINREWNDAEEKENKNRGCKENNIPISNLCIEIVTPLPKNIESVLCPELCLLTIVLPSNPQFHGFPEQV